RSPAPPGRRAHRRTRQCQREDGHGFSVEGKPGIGQDRYHGYTRSECCEGGRQYHENRGWYHQGLLDPEPDSRCGSVRVLSGTAPTIPSTASPFRKIKSVGMLWTLNSPDVKGFSSTFSLPKATRPEYSLASCSMMGATIRQGPHQAAQKSTTINGYFDISEEK